MVKIEWGAKRSCISCGARFYDMQKSTPACPKCGTVYEVQATSRRRGKAAAIDLSKDLLALDGLGSDLDLGVDVGLGSDLIEDTDDLDSGLDDIPDVMASGEDEH
jgi:hypothetical protein